MSERAPLEQLADLADRLREEFADYHHAKRQALELRLLLFTVLRQHGPIRISREAVEDARILAEEVYVSEREDTATGDIVLTALER